MKTKKSRRLVALLMFVLLLATSSQRGVEAKTYYWNVSKNPGTQTAYTTVGMPLYKGEITYQVTMLSGNCSYLLGKCESAEENYYYIDNSNQCVMVTAIGGEDSFYLEFINGGDSFDYMYFRCSVEHNAGIADVISGMGTLSY